MADQIKEQIAQAICKMEVGSSLSGVYLWSALSEYGRDTYRGFADSILQLIKDAGYVKLSADQSLPITHLEPHTTERLMYLQAQKEMLNAGFRRVEL